MITKMLSELKDEDLQSLLSRDVGITDVLSAVNEIVMEVGKREMRHSSSTRRSLREHASMTCA